MRSSCTRPLTDTILFYIFRDLDRAKERYYKHELRIKLINDHVKYRNTK